MFHSKNNVYQAVAAVTGPPAVAAFSISNYIVGGDFFVDFESTTDSAGSTSTGVVRTFYEPLFRFTHTAFSGITYTAAAIGFQLRYTQVPCGQRNIQTTDKLAGA